MLYSEFPPFPGGKVSTQSHTDERIDWPVLRSAATAAARTGRAPYSKLQVGAAGLLDNGEVVQGCNVECASYGLTLCAECGLVTAAQLKTARLVALAVVDSGGKPLAPCGRCRQLLLEVGGPDLLLDTAEGPRPISEFLPFAFTGDDLPE